ncbi:MAG: ABC transporter ATP-binding protein [Clostridia bacterium]|nr:ABC transporter ATP-binding protein [Clostridia bacterium]
MSLLEVKELKKIYRSRGGNTVEALRNVNFSVEEGEFVAVMGESGSGKTTLLNILAALDRPTSGTVLLDGKDISGLGDTALSAFRRDKLGFVFQEFNLLDTFTLRDNICLPLVLAGMRYREMERKLTPLAERLGLTALLDKYPYEVSGGQKQRAAAARALITEPRLLLADEPTGALDSKASDKLLALFEDINRAGQTIFMVTHSARAASRAGCVLFIRDGEVFHRLYRGDLNGDAFYGRISDTLTMLAGGGAQ